MTRKANEPVRMAFKTSTASLIPVWRHQPCIRLKNGMTARRTIMSMGAAVQSRRGSGIWNSKRKSQAHTSEQRIRPICSTSTNSDRQRNRAEDFLLIFLIARQDDCFGYGYSSGSSSSEDNSLRGMPNGIGRAKAAEEFGVRRWISRQWGWHLPGN